MAREKAERQTPGVVFQPRTYQGMQGGIDKLVAAIRPTLGPIHHNVVIEKESKVGKPELLDDGAVIARRIIQLPDRDEDMGAMYLRQLLWTQHEKAGDGSATAALIFHTIYKEGLLYIASGGNAMRLRENLEKASTLILNELENWKFTLDGKEALAHLAETICYDPELAKILGEVFDVIGEFGRLDIYPGRGRTLEREYVEGMYWHGPIFSREMIPDPLTGRAQLEDAAILISDLEISDPQIMLQVLEAAIGANIKFLLLVAKTISEQALALLLLKPNQEKIRVVAAKSPGLSADDHREGLEDLAKLTGGRPYLQAAGDSLLNIRSSDFGFARRAWADHQSFGISGGKGDPRQLRQHIATLRIAFAKSEDSQNRKRLQERIGKLLGGSAEMWIGDPSPIAAQARMELAERTAEAMRGAMRSGVLPGGGLALLACKPILLERYHLAKDADERAACRILARAVEAPVRALLQNAGEEPVEVLTQIAAAGRGCGYDVVQRKIVNMAETGIVDSAAVIHEAAYRAIHGAALALTVDVLIHRANPPDAYHTT
jgi:chaperonin GroEL